MSENAPGKSDAALLRETVAFYNPALSERIAALDDDSFCEAVLRHYCPEVDSLPPGLRPARTQLPTLVWGHHEDDR